MSTPSSSPPPSAFAAAPSPRASPTKAPGARVSERLSSPVHARQSSTQAHTSGLAPDAKKEQQFHVKDMESHVAGEPSPDLFISQFCSPDKPFAKTRFRFRTAKSGVSNEDQFVKDFNSYGADLWPNLVAHNTSASRKKGSDGLSRSPDISIYRPRPNEHIPTEHCSFKHLLVMGDFKGDTEDIISKDDLGFALSSPRGELGRGQLASYIVRQDQNQDILFAFGLFLTTKVARLLRFDRSGVIVSAAFNWHDTDYLVQFLRWLNGASDKALGRDTTVTIPSEQERDLAFNVLNDYLVKHSESGFVPDGFKLDKSKLRKIAVYDDACMAAPANGDSGASSADVAITGGSAKPAVRFFIAPPPHLTSRSVTGRGTSACLAVEVSEEPIIDKMKPGGSEPPRSASKTGVKRKESGIPLYAGPVVHLKDFWRIEEPGIEKEGDIYRELHGRDVPHIPILVCAGDVLCDEGLGTGRQETRTDIVLAEPGWAQYRDEDLRLEHHVHYRLVLGVVGKPLTKFTSMKQVLEVIRDVLLAHKEAVESCNILHRDISVGNIIIGPDGRGLLIDWDLCCRISETSLARRYERTGTWKFMSIALQFTEASVRHRVQHDLESLLWLLLYLTLRYHHHPPWLPKDIQTILCALFDQSRYDTATTLHIGGDNKRSFLVGASITKYQILAGLKCPIPIFNTLENLCELFGNFYLKVNERGASELECTLRRNRQEHASTQLLNHDRVIEIISEGIKHPGWNNTESDHPNSGADDQIADLVKLLATDRNNAQLESSRGRLPSTSAKKRVQSGDRGKRARIDDDARDTRKQAPRRSSRLASLK